MPKDLKANRPVTIKQVKALLDAAEGKVKTLVQLGMTMRQRLGDLRALRWRNVDLTAC